MGILTIISRAKQITISIIYVIVTPPIFLSCK